MRSEEYKCVSMLPPLNQQLARNQSQGQSKTARTIAEEERGEQRGEERRGDGRREGGEGEGRREREERR